MTDTLPHLLTCIAMTILSMPLIYGWLLDICLGDPAWLPHPVVYCGKAIAWGEHRWNAGSHRKMKGAVMSLLLVAGVFALTEALLWLATSVHPLLAIVIKAILIFFCLAGTTLIREVRQVFIALDESLDAGRRQVARIVGRDTSQLSAQEVRTAALETLAENLSDGVIAPLFWLAILGVPGMMAYKMVNTLDSMIGYHTERYLDFGCFAAKMDDVANYLPARLTAALMVITAGRWRLFPFVRKFGPQHASPNSGWPEAALAGILDCRFGGPHYYFGEYFYKPYIGNHERALSTADMHRAVTVNRKAEVAMIVLVVAATVIWRLSQ